MITKLLKKISTKYDFVNHLENDLGFSRKHKLNSAVVYKKDDYELVISSPNTIEGRECVVMTCLNESMFKINFIPNSEIFAEILIKSAIRQYEKNIENENVKIWKPISKK